MSFTLCPTDFQSTNWYFGKLKKYCFFWSKHNILSAWGERIVTFPVRSEIQRIAGLPLWFSAKQLVPQKNVYVMCRCRESSKEDLKKIGWVEFVLSVASVNIFRHGRLACCNEHSVFAQSAEDCQIRRFSNSPILGSSHKKKRDTERQINIY